MTFLRGAPLEFPIFSLLTKCLMLELLQFVYGNILDKEKEKEDISLQSKLFTLDLVQQLMIAVHSMSGSEEQATDFDLLTRFYGQYTGEYISLTDAKAFWLKYHLNSLSDRESEKSHQLAQELKDLIEAKDRNNAETKSARGTLIRVEDARSTMSHIFYTLDLKEAFVGLKNVLLCLSYSKIASIRNKVMKIIKKLIAVDSQAMLKDNDVQAIMKLRISDVSAMTRESALDILLKNLDNFETDILHEFMAMVIDRAHCDTNLSVRKKVIQILSQVLNTDQHSSLLPLKQQIIKILISKWADTSVSVRQSLVTSIR